MGSLFDFVCAQVAPANQKGHTNFGLQCDTPAVPTILQEGDVACVAQWDFSPGAVTDWQRREWPYFVVLLKDARMRIYDGHKTAELNSLPAAATVFQSRSNTT